MAVNCLCFIDSLFDFTSILGLSFTHSSSGSSPVGLICLLEEKYPLFPRNDISRLLVDYQ